MGDQTTAVVRVYAVWHRDDDPRLTLPILARSWQQARSIGGRELGEVIVNMRSRLAYPEESLTPRWLVRVNRLYAGSRPRVLTDDEARLFGWKFEEDE
jgi:hypothetical protein